MREEGRMAAACEGRRDQRPPLRGVMRAGRAGDPGAGPGGGGPV